MPLWVSAPSARGLGRESVPLAASLFLLRQEKEAKEGAPTSAPLGDAKWFPALRAKPGGEVTRPTGSDIPPLHPGLAVLLGASEGDVRLESQWR